LTVRAPGRILPVDDQHQPGAVSRVTATGLYLVFVEEDYKAKVLLYRWNP
jgi:hypothetical protein